MKPILLWLISLAVVVVGVISLEQSFTVWVPNQGWTIDNLVTVCFSFFMIFGGGSEILRRVRVMLPKADDLRRCRSCGAMVPAIAKFCRECGKQYATGSGK